MENVPPPEDRPSFAELGIRTEMQFSLSDERDLLRELAPRHYVTERFVARLNDELATATMEMPRNNSAEAKETRSSIFQARDAVFSLLGLDQADHPLNNAFRNAKILSNRKSPSPRALITSARLMRGMGAPVTDTLKKADRFLYVTPDIAELDTLESALQQHDLSIWENPELAAQPNEFVAPRLARLQTLLARLKLPITVAEVVSGEPGVLRYSEARTSLYADLAVAHASLRSYIRAPHQRRKGKRVPLRQRLALDFGNALENYGPEMFMLGILESGEMGIPQALRVKKEVRSVAVAREVLLGKLNRESIEYIGPGVEAYFAQKPLTAEEAQPFPDLHSFSLPTETPLTPEETLRAEKLSMSDMPWLEEIIGYEIKPEERQGLINRLNEAMVEGSRFIRYLDESERAKVMARRTEFFASLGWFSPYHPLYERFKTYLGRHEGVPPTPDNTVGILRQLAAPAKGQLARVIGSSSCFLLYVGSPGSVSRQLVEATEYARQQQITVEEVFRAYSSWFILSSRPGKG